MTRRAFCSMVAMAAQAAVEPVVVPVCLVLDTKAVLTPEVKQDFWSHLWPQTVATFAAGGIRLDVRKKDGEVLRPPGREPVISGLDPACLNVVITGTVPMEWDSGRSLCGVTLRYRGLHLSMISLYRAHGHLVPFLFVNTCVHEILHALMLDLYDMNPHGVQGAERELRIDALATRMWLLHDGGPVRESTRKYLQRLHGDALPWLQSVHSLPIDK